MTFQTGAGMTFSLSAGAPTTFDQAGYEAKAFTKVGKVTAVGGPPSRVFNVIEEKLLEQRGTMKAKGSYNLGESSLTVLYDSGDAGQTLLETATNADAPYSVKIRHPVLGTVYAQALILGGPVEYGDTDTAVKQTITLQYTIPSGTSDGVVKVSIDDEDDGD